MSRTVYRLGLYWSSRDKSEDAGQERKKRHSVERRLQPFELGFSAFLPESRSSSLLGSLSLSADFPWSPCQSTSPHTCLTAFCRIVLKLC